MHEGDSFYVSYEEIQSCQNVVTRVFTSGKRRVCSSPLWRFILSSNTHPRTRRKIHSTLVSPFKHEMYSFVTHSGIRSHPYPQHSRHRKTHHKAALDFQNTTMTQYPDPIQEYARLDTTARNGLGLPIHDSSSPLELAHTIAYLLVCKAPHVLWVLDRSMQERYLCATKNAGIDGGPYLIQALAAEHDGSYLPTQAPELHIDVMATALMNRIRDIATATTGGKSRRA